VSNTALPNIAAENIPNELKRHPQWMGYNLEITKDGKLTKVPYRVDGKGKASSTDPQTWTDFDTAREIVSRGTFNGMGFALTLAIRIICIDLDHCVDSVTGEIEPWALEIVQRLNSYTEFSPSRTGLHIWIVAVLPPGGRKKGPIEMYDSSRYMTVTGNHLQGTPLTIEDRSAEVAQLHAEHFPSPAPATPAKATKAQLPDDAELIKIATNANDGGKFARLFAGDTGGYNTQSEADQAMCNKLAFYTGRDAARIDRIFHVCGLCREKWDQRHYSNGQTYGQATIAKAIRDCRETYSPSQPSSNGSMAAPSGAGLKQILPQRKAAFTVDELLDADLPEVKWLVPGMITEGLVILAGRPKMGKSWLALLLALTVGIGGVFLGERVKKGRVVYFALEDSPKRLKKRMKALGWTRGADVQFYFNMVPLGGTLAGLPAFIDAIQPDLVIIDTASRAMPEGAKTRDTNAVTCILSPIQQAAVQEACTVMLVDHYRKPQGMVAEAVDHLEEILDSTAKVAVADTIIGLARKRGERGATLKITGRDLEEDVELAINHDTETGCWQLLGDASEVRQSERQRKVIAALRTFNAYTAGTTEIAERSGLPKSHTSSVLQELVNDGLVERLPRQGREQPYRLIVPNTSNNGNSSNGSNRGNRGNHSGDGPDDYHDPDDYHSYHGYHSSEGGSPSLKGDDREQVVF